MPELPEVEIMTRNLGRWTQGRTLAQAELIDPTLLQEGDLSALTGTSIGPARRRGKYTILDVGPERMLILHFRMTGKVVLERPGERRRPRLRLRLTDGTAVIFDDTRRLGQAWVRPRTDEDAFFNARKLGPEPWPEPREGAWWRARFQGARGPIKPALMQQHRVAGLGNIAATEICWRARIDPRRPVPELEADAWDAVAAAVPAFIAHTLDTESGDEIHYLSQGSASPFLAYGRGGAPCRRCGAPIARFTQSGRVTYWCPPCQGQV